MSFKDAHSHAGVLLSLNNLIKTTVHIVSLKGLVYRLIRKQAFRNAFWNSSTSKPIYFLKFVFSRYNPWLKDYQGNEPN